MNQQIRSDSQLTTQNQTRISISIHKNGRLELDFGHLT